VYNVVVLSEIITQGDKTMNEDDQDIFGVMDDDTDFADDDVFGGGDEESSTVTAEAGDTIKEPNAETQEAIAELDAGGGEAIETLDELEDAQEAAVAEAQADAEPEPQEQQQAQAPVAPAPKPKKTAPKKPVARQPRKALTARDKSIRVIMRRAGVEEIPTLDHLLRNKGGKTMRICDIGLFVDEPAESLAELAKECKVPNRVNLSAEVQLSQVKKVGASILQADRMYQPIQVAKIEEDGAFECTSGRHRLAFLALFYGPKANIKVYVEDMTLQEARDAVVVANMARPTKALERAEHAVLQAVHGDADAVQDDLYAKTATTKNKVKKYCVYSVLKKQYPAKLDFKVSLTASRDGGTALTTITIVENFWGASLEWHKDMERAELDGQLKKSVEFLNALAAAFQAQQGFDCQQHMASQTLTAVGKYYADLQSVTGKPVEKAADIAAAIVKMGNVGRQKSEVIYSELAKALRK
jgi:hypothetical protein